MKTVKFNKEFDYSGETGNVSVTGKRVTGTTCPYKGADCVKTQTDRETQRQPICLL